MSTPTLGPLADLLRIRVVGAEPATLRLDVAPEVLNPNGVVHGGAIYTMVDYAMGLATHRTLAETELCATIEIKMSYLGAVREGPIECVASVLKRGRRVVFLDARVLDASGALVATATGSFAVLGAPGA